MKTRRLLALVVLLGTLLSFNFSAAAEENPGNVITGGSGTTIGGYVDSSSNWLSQSQNNRRAWWRGWLHWLNERIRG